MLFILFQVPAWGQVEFLEVSSNILNSRREIKVQLPRNYTDNIEKTYPLIFVMDGEYLFEPVAGAVDYYSYWDEMPQAIVIGIVQGAHRANDLVYDSKNHLPLESGEQFFNFLEQELIPLIQGQYRTTNFKIIVGHNMTANFSNYFLVRKRPTFNGFINISPDYTPSMAERLVTTFQETKQNMFYYLATSKEDIKEVRDKIYDTDRKLSRIDNSKFHYTYDNFEQGSHYALPAQSIARGLSSVFSIYRPITRKEFDEKLLSNALTPFEYLLQKRDAIEEIFGLEATLHLNDYIATYKACKRKGDWDSLKKLGRFAKNNYPETMLGDYLLAVAFENEGNLKRAQRIFQDAFALEEIAFITQKLMLDKANEMKEGIAYN